MFRAPWSTVSLRGLGSDVTSAPTDVLRLAAALCSLPFVPYALLRTVRRHVAPGSGVQLEAELCRSDLVDGSAADGFTLDHDLLLRLRTAMRSQYVVDGDQHRGAVAGLRDIFDEQADLLSPLLAFEERLVWTWLTLDDGASYRALTDEAIRDLVLTAVVEGRSRIFRWASAASRRLPDGTFESQAGWLLGQLCRARRIPFPAVEEPTGPWDDAVVQAMADGLPDRLLGLRRDGTYLELGRVGPWRHVAVPIVDTDPAPLRLNVADRGGWLWLHRDQPVRIPVGTEQVVLVDLRGREYELPPFDGAEAPETTEAQRALELAVEHHRTQEFVRFEVMRRVGNGHVVRLLDWWGTGFLVGEFDHIEPGMRAVGRVASVNLAKRSVSIHLGPRRAASRTHLAIERVTERPLLGTRLRVTSAADPGHGLEAGGRANVWIDGEPAGRAEDVGVPLHLEGVDGDDSPTRADRQDDEDELLVIAESDTTALIDAPSDLVLAVDPRWVHETLREEDLLTLPVTNVVNFGAFLRLPDGREGLLHTSEMVPLARTGAVPYEVGDHVLVRVAAIDSTRRRISFSERRTRDLSSVHVGMNLRGRVVKNVVFGAFVRFDEPEPLKNLQGLIHASEIPDFTPDESLPVGSVVETALVEFDPDEQRFSLGAPRIIGRAPASPAQVMEDGRRRAIELVLDIVARSPEPVFLSDLGMRLRAEMDDVIWATNWFGAGKLINALEAPETRHLAVDQDHIWDPARHSPPRRDPG